VLEVELEIDFEIGGERTGPYILPSILPLLCGRFEEFLPMSEFRQIETQQLPFAAGNEMADMLKGVYFYFMQ
jgi:hypothetical protein